MSDAAYVVRITPLLMPVAGQPESDAAGVQDLELADTTLVENFADLVVNIAINDGRTGKVTLSMHDPIVADLEPFQQAVWIGFQRPDDQAECVLFGQCNVTDDFDAGTVTLDIADPFFKAKHHYLRRGDMRTTDSSIALLNIDKHRGNLPMHAFSISDIVEAARNIQDQQDRGVPVLGLYEWMTGNFGGSEAYDAAATVEFERGQEVGAFISQFAKDINGPDIDVLPYDAWVFPIEHFYATLNCYDPPTDPAAPGAQELGRNLDPVDPDNPTGDEVIFEFGQGVDNLVDVKVNPEHPSTHQHVLDKDKVHRATSADADGSAQTGVWVDWIETDFAIPRPTNANPDPDLSPLQALADVRVKMLGRPPKPFTCVMRPSDALVYQFGHPDWSSVVTGERIGGDWYLGDYVRVRATKGYRTFSRLARVTGVTLKQEGSNGLPMIEVKMIPAIGGTPGASDEDGG